MRITLGNLVLCEGQASSLFPAGWRHVSSPTIQKQSFLRKAAQKTYNRQNVTRTITFRVTREHSAHDVALEFDCTHRAAIELAPSGTLKLEFQNQAQPRTWYIHDASVESVDLSELIGCTTTHTYQITGGTLDQTP